MQKFTLELELQKPEVVLKAIDLLDFKKATAECSDNKAVITVMGDSIRNLTKDINSILKDIDLITQTVERYDKPNI